MDFKKLQSKIKLYGISQQELANAAGITRASLYNKLNNKTDMTLNEYVLIVGFLREREAELMNAPTSTLDTFITV